MGYVPSQTSARLPRLAGRSPLLVRSGCREQSRSATRALDAAASDWTRPPAATFRSLVLRHEAAVHSFGRAAGTGDAEEISGACALRSPRRVTVR